jgi:hypothetical protein
MDKDWLADLERWLPPYLEGWVTRRGVECVRPISLV